MKYLPVICCIVSLVVTAKAQVCTNPGQTPSTAFPVCGSTNIPGCPDGMGYQDKNPYWYKFTCYTAGTLGFEITPNKNDHLYPANAYKADNLLFRVFNRFGQMVWQTKDWTIKWDGTVNGIMQAPGTYVWILSYTDHDTGRQVVQKGTTVLIR